MKHKTEDYKISVVKYYINKKEILRKYKKVNTLLMNNLFHFKFQKV